MKILLYILSVFAFVFAADALISAQSSIHQILAGVGFLVSAVLFSAAAVIGAIQSAARRLSQAQAPASISEPAPSSEGATAPRPAPFAVQALVILGLVGGILLLIAYSRS